MAENLEEILAEDEKETRKGGLLSGQNSGEDESKGKQNAIISFFSLEFFNSLIFPKN